MVGCIASLDFYEGHVNGEFLQIQENISDSSNSSLIHWYTWSGSYLMNPTEEKRYSTIFFFCFKTNIKILLHIQRVLYRTYNSDWFDVSNQKDMFEKKLRHTPIMQRSKKKGFIFKVNFLNIQSLSIMGTSILLEISIRCGRNI